MSAYGTVARHVMAPMIDTLRNTHTMRCLQQLEQSQWWPRERLEELQNLRLQRLITHAYEHVPYYRQVMAQRHVTPSGIRTAADLALLPVLTREQVQQSLQSLVADNWPRKRLHAMNTSGSTGTPLRFYSTREDQIDHGYARSIRAMSWAGIMLGDRIARIGRIHYARTRRGRVLQSLSNRLQRCRTIPVEALSDEALPQVVRQLAEYHPSGIRAYPNALALIAGFIKDNGVQMPAVPSIVTGAAQILSHERRIIHEVFGAEPHSDYSSSEALEIASECSAHQGLHVSMEDLVLEILDSEGRPVPPGAEGRIAITNLHNYGMPFIRYDNGDTGSIMPNTCPCGRGLPLLHILVGRTSEYLVTADGRHVEAMDLHIEGLLPAGVVQYQLVQESIDHFVLNIVPPAAAVDQSWDFTAGVVAAALSSATGSRPHVVLRLVDSIPMNLSGKRLAFVSRFDLTAVQPASR